MQFPRTHTVIDSKMESKDDCVAETCWCRDFMVVDEKILYIYIIASLICLED